MPIDILEELRRRHAGVPGPDAPVYITDSLAKRSIGAGGSFTDPVEEFLGPESHAFGALEAGSALVSGMAAMSAGGIRGIGALLAGLPLEEAVEEVERPEVFGVPAYEPRSERGMLYAEKAVWPFEKIHESAEWWGDKVFNATGNPELAATVSTIVESATLFAGPSLVKKLPGISKGNILKLRRKLRKAKRTEDFSNPELKTVIEDVLAEAKKDPAMMADIQRTLDTTFVEATREPTMAALEKIRAERRGPVERFEARSEARLPEEPTIIDPLRAEGWMERAERRVGGPTEPLGVPEDLAVREYGPKLRRGVSEIMPEEPKVAAPRVEPEVKPVEAVREYRGEKAPEEARAFELADKLGLKFEAYAKPEPGVAGVGYMFSVTEKYDPIFKGAETSLSVEKLSDLPAAVEAKTKWWKEKLAAREVVPEVPEVLGEFEEPGMMKWATPKRVQPEAPVVKKIAKTKEVTKFLDFGPLDDQKIAFIHHIKHNYNLTLERAKDIADKFYGREIDAEGVKAMLAKPITPSILTLPKSRKVAPPKPTFETQATKFELEYKGPRDEPTGIVHEYFDPQTGEHFTADSAAVVGKELETHRRLVEERTTKYSDLTVADYAKLVDDWTVGKGDLDINIIKEQLQDFIAKKPARDFATTADRTEFISGGEELLGKINKRMKERGLVAEPIEDIIAKGPKAIEVRGVLEDGDISEPKMLSGTDRISYIKESAKKRSRLDERQIEALIEEGVDISDKLPPEAQTAYTVYKDMQEMATVSSEPRGVVDIYRDLTEIFDERGSLSYEHLTHEQKMALQRLVADAKKMVGDFTEYLKSLGLTEKQVLMVRKHIDKIREVEPETSTEPRNTWIDAEAIAGGDKIVKQRKLGRDRQAIPLYDSVVKLLQNAKELKRSWFKFLDVPIRDFREAGLEPIHEAYRGIEHAIGEETKVMRADVKELRKGVGWKSGKRIGAYAIAQQKRGLGILEKMGVEVPRLTNFEMAKYSELRSRFETFFERIQIMRAMIGKKPLEKVDNYFTFMRTFSILDRMGIKSNILMDDPGVITNRYMKYGATKFRWGIHRVKRGAIPVELDPFAVYENYSADAIRHLHLSPLIATVNELLGKLPDPATGKMTWELKNHKPILYKSLAGWNNYIAGKTPLDLGWVDKAINKLRRNLVYSILGGSARAGLIQLTALKNTFVELGFGPTLRGVVASIEDAVKFDGKNRGFALEHSKHLSVRLPELELAMGSVMRSIRGGRLGEMQKIAGGASLKFLTLLDMESAIMTWNAAYKFARRKLDRKAAFNFADDVTTRTQASALPGDIAPIQRSALGGAFTTFQTFVINDWGFLTRDVLGIRNAKITNDVVLRKVIRMVIATTAFNILLEDVVGVHSPLPTPIRDLLESMENKDEPINTVLKVALGLTDQVPGMGGARYGKGIAGAPLETVNDFIAALQRKPMAPPLWEPTGKLVGVPSTGQVAKMMKARKRGESPWGQIVGTYTPKHKGRESGLKGLEGLGGL